MYQGIKKEITMNNKLKTGIYYKHPEENNNGINFLTYFY